jgi:hypothetical protein
VLLAACIAALGLPVATAGGGEKFFTVRVAKDQNGPWKVSQNVNIPVGEAKGAYFRVKSRADGNLPNMNFNDFTDDPNSEDYKVNWFKGKDKISSEVKSAEGYEFTLKPDKPLVIRAKVKHVADPGDGTCVDGWAERDVGDDSFALLAVNTECSL